MVINDVRKAVYDACSLTNLPTYDYWVVDEAFPYIVISDLSVDDTLYKLDMLQDVYIDIHVFTQDKGKTNALAYIELIKTQLAALDAVGIRFSTRILNERELGVTHGVLTLQLKNYKGR